MVEWECKARTWAKQQQIFVSKFEQVMRALWVVTLLVVRAFL
jgi:hypothetical protein